MRVNQKVTLTPGTPKQLSVVLGLQENYMANRVFIQMGHGGTGIGYIMDGIGGLRTPSKSNAGDVTAELAAATASAPGGSYGDPSAAIEFGLAPSIDLRQIWVDGDQSDPMYISAVLNT